jgi:hypothetical protein
MDSKFEIPERFIVSEDQNTMWKVQTLKENHNLPSLSKTKTTSYELCAIISKIKNPLNENDRGHVVSYVKKFDSLKWILYNDFTVSEVTEPWKTKPWKSHCVLFYQRIEMNSIVPQIKYVNPISTSILTKDTQK